MKPRVGMSPPELPTITLSLTTSGAAMQRVPHLEVVDDDVPDDAAGVAIERDQVRVERAHEQPIAERGEAAVRRVAAAVGQARAAARGGSARSDAPVRASTAHAMLLLPVM